MIDVPLEVIENQHLITSLEIPMQKAKLLKLADFLDKLPRKKFNMDSFVIKHGNTPDKISLKCQAVACAFGWCTVVFPKSGLKLKKIYPINEYHDITYEYDIKYKNHTNFHAAAKFFNIDLTESEILFMPDDNPKLNTPKQVAKRIRRFVKNKE